MGRDRGWCGSSAASVPTALSLAPTSTAPVRSWQVQRCRRLLVFATLLRLLAKASAVGDRCLFNGLAALRGLGALGLTMPTIVAALATAAAGSRSLLAALGLPLALSAFFWIGAPTKEGRAVLDRITGFKHYLSITERERLDRMQAPRDTLQMFERWLPYAVALGVENRWADRFSGAARRGRRGRAQQGFAWYAGPTARGPIPARFAGIDRLVAVELDQLRLYRAGLEQRLGRRRIVRRRRRRRRRWRLVTNATRAAQHDRRFVVVERFAESLEAEPFGEPERRLRWRAR